MNLNNLKIYNYVIDDADNIKYINNEQWDEFYKQNHNSSSCLGAKIISKSLWDFIGDFETRHMYETILEKVRESKKQITLPFRCDSPTQRRFLSLTLRPLDNNYVEFISKIEKIENREKVALLDYKRPSSDELLSICSMCKKVKLEENLWDEVEVAVKELRLFEKNKLPMLTHGLCPYCKRLYIEEANKFISQLESKS